MVQVSKQHAGADSFGNVWPTDGAVIEVPEDQARDLVAIPDGGFTVVETPVKPVEPKHAAPEPARTDIDEAPPPATRRSRSKASDVSETASSDT